MKMKLIAIVVFLFLTADVSSALAAKTGSAPSTSSRSGSFSKSPSSSYRTSPSSSSSTSTFSGGASNNSTVPSTASSGGTTKSGSTYSTGAQRPSANVTNGSTINPNTGSAYYGGSTYSNTVPAGQRAGSFWPAVGAFAAGTLLGSMIHPWGGYYPNAGGGYVHQPFSFMSLILDLIVLAFILWLAVFIFRLIFVRR